MRERKRRSTASNVIGFVFVYFPIAPCIIIGCGHTESHTCSRRSSLSLSPSYSLFLALSLPLSCSTCGFFSCLLLRVLIQLNPVLIVDLMAANTAADIAAIVIVIIASCLAFFSFNLLAQIYKFMQPLIEN